MKNIDIRGIYIWMQKKSYKIIFFGKICGADTYPWMLPNIMTWASIVSYGHGMCFNQIECITFDAKVTPLVSYTCVLLAYAHPMGRYQSEQGEAQTGM